MPTGHQLLRLLARRQGRPRVGALGVDAGAGGWGWGPPWRPTAGPGGGAGRGWSAAAAAAQGGRGADRGAGGGRGREGKGPKDPRGAEAGPRRGSAAVRFEDFAPERIRNFSIIAHVDHGKVGVGRGAPSIATSVHRRRPLLQGD